MAKNLAKVYINGRLVGFHKEPEKLRLALIEERRKGKIPDSVNIGYYEDTNEIYINTDEGRVQRPLIVVENGKPKIEEKDIDLLKEGKKTFEDLVKEGKIEFLDAEEEEKAFIAVKKEELTKEHTHLEIDPVGIFSIITSFIPYIEHDMAGKVLHGAKMFKQAVGFGQANYNLRTDTEAHLLYYPEKEIVYTKTMEIFKTDERPQVQNFVVAILPYYGFNTQDAIVINQGAIDRGLARSAYLRTYESVEQKYPGGQNDRFEVPTEETVGYLGDECYTKLGEDGLIEVEEYVKEKDIIIGKTSPPKFLEEISEFGVMKEKRRESSLSIKRGKEGYVDKVILTENEDGNRLAKVKIRSIMIPEIGDKFSSKHGQKGILALIVPEEDMPFTAEGIKPDLILNPHSIPSRMTMGHLLETLAGKAGALDGERIDGTAFSNVGKEEINEILEKHGFNRDGKELFYDGITGKRIEGEIFTGIVAYRRLYHVVKHKLQARARGPVQILTRQPTEGKEREGGLRFGEMEGETLIGHGAAMLLQEKLIEDADKATEWICEKCGVLAIKDVTKNKTYCPICKSTNIYQIDISHSFKLLMHELMALGIIPRLRLGDKA